MNDETTPKKSRDEINLGIPEPEYPDITPIIGELRREKGMLPSNVEKTPNAGEVARHVQVTQPQIYKMIAMVATNAWKLKMMMTDGKEGVVKEECKRFYRPIEAILDSLDAIGIKIIDRTGETFDYGLPEKVTANHPTPNISKEYVIETQKPTITLNDQYLQVGEVIIATPERQDPSTQFKP